MARVAGLIVSAGYGQRLGTEKTFLNLGGKPLITWAVSVMQSSSCIDEIILVLNKSVIDAGKNLIAKNGWSKVHAVCEGGERRQDSVHNGLKAINNCEWVVIHDGARPFLTEKLIKDGLETAGKTGAAAAAVAVKDTVKQVDDDGIVTRTLHRQTLRSVQTPQVFRVDIITKAFELINGDVTDDAGIVEKAGYRVKLFEGDERNIKITTRYDLIMAEVIARSAEK